MRVLAAQFKHETNTFSPVRTNWESFGPEGPLSGTEAVAALDGTQQPFAAFIDFARTADVDLVVPLAGRAAPGGLVRAEAFERAASRVLAALTPEIDIVLLDLHGAMVTEHFDDADAELVNRLRRKAPHVPLGVALDLRANVADRLIHDASIVVGCRPAAPEKGYEAGERVVRLTARILGGAL